MVAPPTVSAQPAADIELDYVGSVDNAAKVIAALHRGEKRLVFCESRKRVEELGTALRSNGVTTFLSHASLSIDERRRAEAAFADARDCVIVSTSTLELGIDVGDLDRVIQIDAPRTVASFLQRIGRTGRRPDSQRNCLFLATDRHSLVQAAALLVLWETGAGSSQCCHRPSRGTSSLNRSSPCACSNTASGNASGRNGGTDSNRSRTRPRP
ncbi:helicase-related protein [Salinispora arenicola]|uniref:helicase-related protein n=1 Tax=Salinispora arenicola TaxID=168697 RepID=UPI0027DE2A73|nr:helicase-related protein [Salinispora arenicola]